MTQRRGREESDDGTERTEESVTSTSCIGGGGGEVEEVVLKKKQRTEEKREGEDEEVESGRGCDRNDDGSAVGWEKLSPMVLRVLLVEADDSTRQIISALLRKCGYRVAAVPNGLKAWEVLKGRPNEIDLILTEVDLPSVSGFALLSLIMDHEICKNIPVIMMSTEDSILTVYKCMLRGAADYLIKPIRRNELGNLWQHVWRRQTLLGKGITMKDRDAVEDKPEPANENNAARSKRSSGDGSFTQRNKECGEKGSATQSSCTVVDVDALGSEDVEDQPAAACKDVNGMTPNNGVPKADMDYKACDRNNANYTGEEIDFMGAAPLHISSSAHMKSEFDSYGRLDLALRSSFRGGFEIEGAAGKNSLGHSNASSFTRYTGKQLYLQHSEAATVSNPKELAADSDQNSSGTTDSGGPSPGSISPPVVQVQESETENTIHQQNILPTQDLVCGMRTNDIKTPASSSLFPPIQQSVDASFPQSPCSPNRLEASAKSSHASDSTNETPQNQDKRSESSEEDQGHVTTPAVDRSSSSSLCDGGGGASHNNSAGGYGSACGSNSDPDQVGMIKAETESNNTEGGGAGSTTHVRSSTRSVEREAALAKFRLKRKDRCFDKKVRYESRKTLAEKRPRVKGQFVRQVPAMALPLVSEQ